MKIGIYKYSDTEENRERESVGKICRVQAMPEDKTEDEIKKAVSDYNSNQSERSVSIAEVSDEIYEAVKYLIKDRRIDINRHIEVLDDIKHEISQLDDYITDAIGSIKNSVKKQTKKSN